MRLRRTAHAMAHEILCRLGWRLRFEDRTHQHGVFDLATSHVDMARVIVGSSHGATVSLYTADGDYRLTIRSDAALCYELETPDKLFEFDEHGREPTTTATAVAGTP